jgi:hypothetical protein
VYLLQSANDALAQEKERIDVLLAQQYNLISCVLQQDESSKPKRSLEHRTLGENTRCCCCCCLLCVGAIPASGSVVHVQCDTLHDDDATAMLCNLQTPSVYVCALVRVQFITLRRGIL